MTPKQSAFVLGAVVVLAFGFVAVRALEQRPHAPRGVARGASNTDVALEPEEIGPGPERNLAIGGVVSDANGAPLAKVNVTARSLETGQALERRAETDASGRFELDGLASGRYRVSFWSIHRDPASPPLAGAVVDEVDAGRDDLRVTLRPGGYARGVVQDANGKPLAQVTVFANTPSGARFTAKQSDADGRFELVLAPGDEYELVAQPAKRAATREELAAPPDPTTFARVGGIRAGDEGIVLQFP